MARFAIAIAGVGLVVGLAIIFIGPRQIASLAASTAPSAAPTNVVADQQILQMESMPGSGRPEIQETTAIALAESHVPAFDKSTSIQSRYVNLTLRDSDGAVARGIQSRSAWLVTFAGVAYAPSASVASVCNCGAAYSRPSTMAALDAGTGDLIAILGVAN
jgi:hypothetical protein